MAGGSDESERINVFEIDGMYLFKHYFDETEVYNRLRPYYNNQQYRFEIPSEDIEDILTYLSKNGYRMVVVDDLGQFIVCVRKYKEHPKNIFRESVVQRSSGDYHCFLMKTEAAVRTAIRATGRPFVELGVPNPYLAEDEPQTEE